MENKDKEILLKILKHAEHAISYSSKYDNGPLGTGLGVHFIVIN